MFDFRHICVCVAAQFASKLDTSRDIGVVATKHLATQCSDAGAMETVVKHYFSLLNGSLTKRQQLFELYAVALK